MNKHTMMVTEVEWMLTESEAYFEIRSWGDEVWFICNSHPKLPNAVIKKFEEYLQGNGWGNTRVAGLVGKQWKKGGMVLSYYKVTDTRSHFNVVIKKL
jgi:hypothetical protein